MNGSDKPRDDREAAAEALKAAQQRGDTRLEMDLAGELGLQRHEQGDLDGAAAYLARAVEIARRIGDTTAVALNAGNAGNVMLAASRLEQAAAYYEEAAHAYAIIQDRVYEAWMLTSWGSALQQLGRRREALERHRQALQLGQEHQDPEVIAAAAGNLGSAHAEAGDLDVAADHHREALVAALSTGKRDLVQRAQSNLTQDLVRIHGEQAAEPWVLAEMGRALYRVGDLDSSAAYLDKAVARLSGDGPSARYGEILEALADVHMARGDHAQALARRREVMEVVRTLDDPGWLETTLANLGAALLDLGDVDGAVRAFEEELAVAHQLGEPDRRARAVGNLGVAALWDGDLARALRYLDAQREQARDPHLRANAALQLGNTYLRVGALGRAERLFQEAADAFAALGDDRFAAGAWNGIGLVRARRGDYDRALEAYNTAAERALNAGHRGVLQQIRSNVALLDVARTDWCSARKRFEDLLTDLDAGDPAVASVLGNLGAIYRELGQPEQARAVLCRALDLAAASSNANVLSHCLRRLGELELGDGRYTEALPLVERAVELDEAATTGLADRESVSIIHGQEQGFELLQRVHIARGEVGPALVAAERGKARALLRLLERRHGAGARAKEMKAVLQDVVFDAVARGLGSGSSRGDDQPPARGVSPILRAVGLNASATAAVPPMTLEAIQHLSAELDAPLLVYSLLGPNRLAAWVADARAVHFCELPPPEGSEWILWLTACGRHLRTAAGGTPEAASSAEAAGADLEPWLRLAHDRLIAPVAEWLPTQVGARIAIVPSGPLFTLPVAAFIDASGRSLVERYATFTAPAINAWRGLRDRRARGVTGSAQPVVIGNPTLPEHGVVIGDEEWQFDPLPAAEAEATAVAAHLRTTALIGPAATKREVLARMRQAPVVHLAAHSYLSERSDELSAIILAPSGDDAGVLMACEIAREDLAAGLVVLSACSTGLGDVTGDGVAGLSRALHAAGTRSVIVSLWKVDDQATAHLMRAFYEAIGTTDYAHALRLAMMHTRRRYPHPVDWAGFVLSGLPA